MTHHTPAIQEMLAALADLKRLQPPKTGERITITDEEWEAIDSGLSVGYTSGDPGYLRLNFLLWGLPVHVDPKTGERYVET